MSPTAGSLAELEADGGGILAPGTYSGDYVFTKRVDVQRSPGVVLTGRITFAPWLPDRNWAGSEGSIFRGGVKFDARVQGPNIHASEVIIQRCEVTNANRDIGIRVEGWYDGPKPTGVKIRRNWIHHIGLMPRTNYCHGIYDSGRGTLIQNNWIEDCADRGIQFYSDNKRDTPSDSKAHCNVIRRCGIGVIFNGTRNEAIANHIEDCAYQLIHCGYGVGAGNRAWYNHLRPTNAYGNLGVTVRNTDDAQGQALSLIGNIPVTDTPSFEEWKAASLV